ncbi:MAG: FecR domain-containing protein, partial [Chloroflexi bacterium]|nr:FecR domain-containing protein [Chloroflexota bacterium]
MMNTPDKRKYGLTLFLILALALSACARRTPTPPPVPATDTAPAPGAVTPTGAELPRTVTLNEVRNTVQERPEQNETIAWSLATNGTVVQQGGQVRTLENATARLDFSEGTIVRLAPRTTFTIEKLEVVGGNFLTRLLLQAGKIWIILRGGEMDVDTPVGVASVRGSYLSVEVVENEDGTNTIFITCLEGDCTLKPGGGEAVQLSDGQTGFITGDPTTKLAGPAQVGVMSPEDLNDWLQQNPEATVVVPSVTPLVRTRTPSGVASATPTRTPTRGATPT